MAVARADRQLMNRVFDWAKIAQKIPEGSLARKDLSALRTKHEQLRERLNKNPEAAAPIDFNHYRQMIAAPGFVDNLEKTYKDLLPKIPYPEDSFSSDINAREQEADKHFANVIAEAKDIAKELQISLDEFLTLPPFEEMTWDDFFDRFPKYEAMMQERMEHHDYKEQFEAINATFAGPPPKL